LVAVKQVKKRVGVANQGRRSKGEQSALAMPEKNHATRAVPVRIAATNLENTSVL